MYLHAKSLESRHCFSPDYLSSCGSRVTTEMRSTLVNWLVEIHVSLLLAKLRVLTRSLRYSFFCDKGSSKTRTGNVARSRQTLGRHVTALQSWRDSFTALWFSDFLDSNQTRVQAVERELQIKNF